LGKESFQDPIHAYFVENGQAIKDITNEHLFTGYSPLIIVLTSSDLNGLPPMIEILFTQRSFQPNDLFRTKDALARLSLRLIRKQKIDNNEIYYYEGTKGQHHFLSPFHQYMIGLNNRFYNRKKGNVFLDNNLYKQVQIAYSIPRIISLITVGTHGSYNLFPTDLHGWVNEQYYISSLRHGGQACMQVENAGRIVISQVHSSAYKTVYGLGKNHMQRLKPKENFSFSGSLSDVFHLPLPGSLLSYRELDLIESFEHGIHKLFLYKIISSHSVNKEPFTLSHIHNCYATWRYKKGLPGDYLFR